MEKRITEESWRVYKRKFTGIVELKDFDDFESAYNFFQENKDEYVAGNMSKTYKVTETFFDFDNRDIPRDQMMDMINNT